MMITREMADTHPARSLTTLWPPRADRRPRRYRRPADFLGRDRPCDLARLGLSPRPRLVSVGSGQGDVPWPSGTALAEHGWIQSANFALSGTLLFVFVRALRREFRRPVSGRIAGALLTVLAVALALSAFNTDFGTFGEGPETWNGWIHVLAFVVLMFSAITGMAATAVALRGNPGWRAFPLAALLVAAFIPVSFVIPGGAGFYGLLLLLFGWFELAALRLWKLTRTEAE
jgi:hypothetical protein